MTSSGRFVAASFLVLASLPSAFGQSATAQPSIVPSAPAQQAQPAADYLKEALVFESNQLKVVYQEDGSGTREEKSVVKVLSQAGVEALAILKFAYTSSDETVEFDYVRVRKPDGNVVNTPDYNIQDLPAEVTQTAPMYSDIHEKHVTVKALAVGDTLEYLVRYRTTKPQVPGQFWYAFTFPKDVIIKDELLTIDVPRQKYAKVVSPEMKAEIKDEGTRRIYTWKTKNLERKELEAASQWQQQRTPTPSVQISTFHSWDEVGQWYGELARSQVIVTPQLQAKAAELSKGLTSDDDKIRAIYSFVSTRYHYVSLSFGIGRYQPHPAQDVFENEYGDCKDKHTLLAALLKAAGYDAWPALINATGDIDPEMPSPGQFNHLITVVPRGSASLWLDTTPGVAPVGLLLGNLRDQQALVMPTGKPALLMTTPANPPFASAQTFTIKGKLTPEGTFLAHVKVSGYGDVGVIERLVFQRYPSSQWKDVVQGLSAAWGFGGEVSAVEASDVTDINKPFEFSYDYKREKIGDWDNLRLTAPFPPIGVESAAAEKKKPKEPVFVGAPGSSVYKAEIELPAGFSVTPPSKFHFSDDFADFDAQYAFKDGVLSVTRQFLVKQSKIAPADWEKYQKLAKAVDDDHDTWIVLNNGSKTASDSEDSEADRLFQEAYKASNNRDLGRAEDLYKQLVEKDPKYPYGHSNLGNVYLREGRTQEGIVELRKEEEIHPEETYSYRNLAWALEGKHDIAGAIDQLQKLLAIDPKDRDGALSLARLLSQEKRYPEALAVLEKATALAPNSQPLELQLGLAYVRNGQKDKGIPVLEKALNSVTDPATSSALLNNVAYTLIEMDAGLEVAQKFADKAVQQQEEISLKAGSGREGLFNTLNLGGTWDTVGWLHYRLGEYDKALPYLRAAWLLDQHADVGDHLGQLYAKMGKKEEAAHTYRLAYAAAGLNGLHTASESLNNIKEHYKQLLGNNADPGSFSTTRRANGTFTPMPAEELSRMRQVKVTGAHHSSGSGTFSLVFSPGKVEEVKQLDGDSSLATLSEQIKAAKFNVEFPDTRAAKLVRHGLMSCGGMGCDLVLLPPEDKSLFASE